MPRYHSLALALALSLAACSAAQTPFGLPEVGAVRSLPEGALTTPGPRTYELTRPFVIGRDNLGFENLGGAISIAGMSGNCYTLAAVSKLFYEAAEFRPGELVSPAIAPEHLEVTLRSSSYPSPGFPVRGFPNLYEMSTAPEGVDAEDWMEGWARYHADLDASPPEGPSPDNTDAMTELYQMISTIHYMHYVQFQAGDLLGSAVRQATQGGASVPEVMAQTIEDVKAQLAADRPALVCIFNPRPEVFFGHVVLGYKLVEVPAEGYADIYVYDSNAQYAGSRRLGADTDESILRVHDDGRLELKAREADGDIVDLEMYDDDEWFNDADATVLLALDDLESDASLRERLADKLADARQNTGFVLATGDLLERLTTVSPEESPLSADVAAFVRDAAAVSGGPTLAEGAGVEELNAFLEAHADQAVRTVFPMALPDGLEVEDVALRFDPADSNRAELESTLVLSRSASVDAVIQAVASSALAGDEGLGQVVAAASQAFEGQVLRLRTRLEISKGAGSARLGRYGPRATLRGSHLVVGDIEGGEMAAGDDHRIEIAEAVVQQFVRDLLERMDVIDERVEHDYEIPALGDRTGYAEIDDVEVVTRGPFLASRRGRIGIRVAYHGFAPVVSRNRGITVRSRWTTLWIKLRPGSGRNHVEVRGRVDGDHRIRHGLEWVPFLGRSVNLALRAFMGSLFDAVDERLDEAIEGELDDYIELVGAGPRFRDLEVDTDEVSLDIESFTVDVQESLARVLGFTADDVPVAVTGIDVTDDRVVVSLRND